MHAYIHTYILGRKLERERGEGVERETDRQRDLFVLSQPDLHFRTGTTASVKTTMKLADLATPLKTVSQNTKKIIIIITDTVSHYLR